jgi:hypothetical protein
MHFACSARRRGGWSIARAFVLAAIAAIFASGCGRLIGAAAADTLSAAILNQDDPVLVTSGVPAYLLLVEGLIHQRPGDPALLAAGAQLFALYGARFASDRVRAAELTAKARRYGERAICAAHAPACTWEGLDHQSFVAALEGVGRRNIGPLYAYAISWLSHLDATSDDWGAVAELPWVEAAMERVLALDERWDDGGVHGYLGTLNSLRPPALGGQPDVARAHFERAIELSNGRDLAVQVEYARRYARMMFDQDLHDRLLRDVLAAPVDAPGLTLFNVLAKREAERLLESGREYF